MHKAFFRKSFYFIEKHTTFSKKFTFFSIVLSTYPKGPARAENSFIFNFEYVNKV